MNSVKPDGICDLTTQLIVMRQRIPGFPVEHDRIVRLIADVHQRAVSSYNVVLRKYGIAYRAYVTLMTIYACPGQRLTPSEIARATGERKTTMTRLADELIEKGLIGRKASTSDRRSVVLHMTSAGADLIEKVAPQISDLLRIIYEKTEKWEQDVLGISLSKQLASLTKVQERNDSA